MGEIILERFYQFDGPYVERLRRGDLPTTKHFAEYFGRLIRLKLGSRSYSKCAIEDIRQETFLRVWVALQKDDGIRQPERFGAFVNSVCNNVAREHDRRVVTSDHNEDDSATRLFDTPIKVVDTVTEQELQRQVARILAHLPPKHRDLIRKVFLEECDKDELCREFGVTPNYLRVLLHRAIRQFRELYSKQIQAQARRRSREHRLFLHKSLDRT